MKFTIITAIIGIILTQMHHISNVSITHPKQAIVGIGIIGILSLAYKLRGIFIQTLGK